MTLGMLPIDSHLTNLVMVTVSSNEVELLAEHYDDPCNTHLQSTFVLRSA